VRLRIRSAAVVQLIIFLLLLVAAPTTDIRTKYVAETVPAPSIPLFFTHTGVITTIFWVGENASGDNGYIANDASAWDDSWQQHFGGLDDPNRRNGFRTAGFIPKENSFYIALPYSDVDDNGKRKPSATACPLAQLLRSQNVSWCKNSWVAIRHDSKIAYAQWEDVGPFKENDAAYVFDTAQPSNKRGAKAGLDVSPAVRDYLGLQDVDMSDWTFVSEQNVPDGPWKQTITMSTGDPLN